MPEQELLLIIELPVIVKIPVPKLHTPPPALLFILPFLIVTLSIVTLPVLIKIARFFNSASIVAVLFVSDLPVIFKLWLITKLFSLKTLGLNTIESPAIEAAIALATVLWVGNTITPVLYKVTVCACTILEPNSDNAENKNAFFISEKLCIFLIIFFNFSIEKMYPKAQLAKDLYYNATNYISKIKTKSGLITSALVYFEKLVSIEVPKAAIHAIVPPSILNVFAKPICSKTIAACILRLPERQ